MWQSLGFVPHADALTVSLFCYTNAALPALLECWAEGDEPVAVVVPRASRTRTLDRFSGGRVPHAGAPLVRGRLTLAVVPFVDQDAFDRRLWACDLNIVRGEDSFVRAQWAGQPYVWHIYPQEDDAHLTKMDAFLTRIEANLPDGARLAQRTFWYAWNAADPVTTARRMARLPRRDARRLASWRAPGRAPWPASRICGGAGQVLRKSFIIMGFPISIPRGRLITPAPRNRT